MASLQAVFGLLQSIKETKERELAALEMLATMVAGDGVLSGLAPHQEWGIGTPRQAANHARSGKIRGAKRIGKTWYAEPAAVAEFVAVHGAPPPVKAPGPEPEDEIDAIVSRARRGRR